MKGNYGSQKGMFLKSKLSIMIKEKVLRKETLFYSRNSKHAPFLSFSPTSHLRLTISCASTLVVVLFTSFIFNFVGNTNTCVFNN